MATALGVAQAANGRQPRTLVLPLPWSQVRTRLALYCRLRSPDHPHSDFEHHTDELWRYRRTRRVRLRQKERVFSRDFGSPSRGPAEVSMWCWTEPRHLVYALRAMALPLWPQTSGRAPRRSNLTQLFGGARRIQLMSGMRTTHRVVRAYRKPQWPGPACPYGLTLCGGRPHIAAGS